MKLRYILPTLSNLEICAAVASGAPAKGGDLGDGANGNPVLPADSSDSHFLNTKQEDGHVDVGYLPYQLFQR